MMPESEKPKRGEHLRYLLTAYVFESISEAGRREVEEHLAACAECRAELEELRGTVASVEDAFAGEAGGAAGYSFEARRLERVLAAGRTRGAGGWLGQWRTPLGLAAAAVIVIGLGAVLMSTLTLRTARKSASPATEYAIELARRIEAPAPTAGAVPAAPPPADKHTLAFIAGGSDERGPKSADRVELYDTLSDGAAREASAPGETDVAAVTLWAAPAARPEATLEQAQAPEAKPAEVAFEQAPLAVGEDGRAVGGIGGGTVGGAAGAYGQRFARRSTLSRQEAVAAGPAAPVPPAAEPPHALGDVAQATEPAKAAETRRLNESLDSFGAEASAPEKAGGDRRGGAAGKPVEELARGRFDPAKPVAGVDAIVNAADDQVVIAGGGNDYDHLGGEPTMEYRLDGAAAASAPGARDYREKPQVVMEQGLQDRNVVELYKKGLEPAQQKLEEKEVTKLASQPQETDEAYYSRDLKRDVEKPAAGEKQVADGLMVTVESRFLDVQDAEIQIQEVHKNSLEKEKVAAFGSVPEEPAIVAGFEHDFSNPAGGARGTRPIKALQQQQQAGSAQGWSYGVQVDAAAKPGLPPPDPSAMEGLLRGYVHYKRLDQGLALDEFAARALEVPAPVVGDEGLGQEGFRKRHGVNPFVDTRRDHFSTFGMDVDTASYTLARGALAAGKLPDPRHIRVEEFVNYFPEDLPASRDRVFSVRCEGGPAPFGEGLDLLKVTVKARDLLPGERKDAVLTFAVDTSGSMHEGDRLALVREALATLVRSLKPDDRVAVVGFSDHPYLVLPHTPAREADRILGAVASLTPRGDTNFEAGLALAYRVADEVLEPKAVHRVILCSDGVATAGARGAEEILKRVEVFAKRGIYLSSIGFGMGKYNDKLLETLADKGNGNYAYADDLKAAADVFQKNLPATLQVLAQDAKVQVDFNPEVVSHYRLVGYENRDIADRDFRNDKVDAGEVGPGTTVTVLYEVLRRPGSSGDVGRVHVRYRDTGTGRVEEESYPLPPGVVATRLEETSDRFRFIACAAETAELLRGSYWARNGSYGKVIAALHGLGAGFRGRPEWSELAALAARAQEMTIQALQGK